jgi:hypothetical protein
MPQSNPFYHRGPVSDPDFFFGRGPETSYLFDLLRKGQSVAISGPRRIGKTSLLMHVKDPGVATAHSVPAEATEFLYLDGGALDGLGEEEFYGAVFRALGEEVDSIPYLRFLEFLRGRLSVGGRSVVILLDEFELIAANPRFGLAMFNRLRALAAQYPVRFVTASKNPIWKLTQGHPDMLSSPFFNFFAPLSLGPMEESEARRLPAILSAKAGKPFSERTIDRILSLAGPHPLFLQVVGFRTFEAAADDGEVADSEWETIRRRLMADLEPHLQYYWNELDEEERYALAALPLEAGGTSQLVEAGLIRDGRYIGSILEQFVRRQKVAGLLQGGPFLLDLRRNQAIAAGNPVHLTPTEFSLLKILLQNPGRVLTPLEIETSLWPGDQILDPDRARGVVKKLRNALGETGELLVNQRGQGYLLAVE